MSRKPFTTRLATVSSDALRIVAFSRSSRPNDPTVWLSETGRSAPHSASIIAAACSSWSVHAGLNAHDTATAETSPAHSPANRRMASSSRGATGVPSYSKPPSMIWLRPMTRSRRSWGQLALGRTPSDEGAASRSTPTRSRSRRRMMALVGCVVPSMALPSREVSSIWSMTVVIASMMPSMGSGVVAVFVSTMMWPLPSTTTASVFVPPTSTPSRRSFISRIAHAPGSRRSRCRIRRPWAPRGPTSRRGATRVRTAWPAH